MTYESGSGAVLFAKDVARLEEFYSTVLGLRATARDDDHVVLESPHFQLVVHRLPREMASKIEPTAPPARRWSAAVKLVFFVPSIASVRAAVDALGGAMESAEKEWPFQGLTVCDAIDPEGNVIQFRGQVG